jgi:hypothetical protein
MSGRPSHGLPGDRHRFLPRPRSPERHPPPCACFCQNTAARSQKAVSSSQAMRFALSQPRLQACGCATLGGKRAGDRRSTDPHSLAGSGAARSPRCPILGALLGQTQDTPRSPSRTDWSKRSKGSLGARGYDRRLVDVVVRVVEMDRQRHVGRCSGCLETASAVQQAERRRAQGAKLRARTARPDPE